MLRQLPPSADPNVLVGFDTRDDAGVFRLPDGRALVQTLDFFTPIVDDPYAYGQIAAANSLSDVYAMGGAPLTAMNIAAFDPDMAPAEVWSGVFRGMYDKCVKAGAAVVGGHSVKDPEPKFGLSVTGMVDPDLMFANTEARAGDRIYLSKPLGTGIVTTGGMREVATPEEMAAAIAAMAELNRDACRAGLAAGVRCATDITGFGLSGHLFNVAKASEVRIELDSSALPVLPGVERLVGLGMTTGGGTNNLRFLENSLSFADSVPPWMRELVVDPQTSGGLALFSQVELPYPCIGEVVAGAPSVDVR